MFCHALALFRPFAQRTLPNSSGSLQTLSAFPADNPRRIKVQQDLEKGLAHVEHMLEMSKDPVEFKRLEGMCDMHDRFVRTLESLQPLLKEQCP